jgi:hypothetical protein
VRLFRTIVTQQMLSCRHLSTIYCLLRHLPPCESKEARARSLEDVATRVFNRRCTSGRNTCTVYNVCNMRRARAGKAARKSVCTSTSQSGRSVYNCGSILLGIFSAPHRIHQSNIKYSTIPKQPPKQRNLPEDVEPGQRPDVPGGRLQNPEFSGESPS